MWIVDEEVIDQLGRLTGACVIVTKQERKAFDDPEHGFVGLHVMFRRL